MRQGNHPGHKGRKATELFLIVFVVPSVVVIVSISVLFTVLVIVSVSVLFTIVVIVSYL